MRKITAMENYKDDHIINQETNAFSQLNAKILAANSLSQSLYSSLDRQYLDIPLEEADYIQTLPPPNVILEDIKFIQLQQSGMLSNEIINRHINTLDCTLKACHKGCQNIVFLVVNDGHKNQIYFGIRKLSQKKYYSDQYIENLGHFLQANWQGSCFQMFSSESEQEQEQELIQNYIDKTKYAVAITGVPSRIQERSCNYTNLDLFLSGIKNSPFVYMIVAEPINDNEINKIIYNLRELKSRIHSLAKITFNDSFTHKILKTREKTEGESIQHAQTQYKTSEGGKIGGILNVIDLGSSFFPPAAFVSPLVRARNKAIGASEMDSTISSIAYSETGGFSKGSAQAIGEEHINVHAEATIQKIQKHLSRFEQSLADGCWNTGVYLLTDKEDNLEYLSNHFTSVYRGKNMPIETLRAHTLKKFWRTGNDYYLKQYFKKFTQPRIGLNYPNSLTGKTCSSLRKLIQLYNYSYQW